MDLLKSHKRRSRVSEILYVTLNIGLAVSLFVVVLSVQSTWLAYLLVLLSKWRALAVRPRFWFANLVANLVDIIVGLAVVTLMYAASGIVPLQAALAVIYTVWLLFIKPRSSKLYVAIQAAAAVFFGVTALSLVTYAPHSTVFVAGMWLIGYSSARHVLGSYEENMTVLYSLIAGLMFAELGWLGYHWLFAYTLPGFGQIKLSQLAILTTLYCFVAERAYASYHRHGVVKTRDILMPTLLALSITIVLVIFYNDVSAIKSV